MKIQIWLAIMGVAAALARSSPGSAASANGDEAAVRAVEVRQAQTWNAHDIHAYGALFTNDADVINVLGWWWKSRAELEAKLGAAHQGPFRLSVLSIGDVTVMFPAPDVAVAHVTWSMTGALTPDGNPAHVPEHGIQTQVLLRRGGAWLISAFQNTNGSPERAFER